MTDKSRATANRNTRTDSSPPPRADKKVQLEETLKRRIVSMEIAPGAVVDEISLSQEFGLSRPPVRETMRALAAQGYIVLEANRAARAAPMNYQSLRSFFLAAPMIYVAISQLAATHGTAEDIEELRRIQALFRQAIDTRDTASRVYYNNQFHYFIGTMSRNDYLLASLNRLLIDHARLAQNFYLSPAVDEVRKDMLTAADQHDEIIEALEQRDVEKVERTVLTHWHLSRQRMTDYVIPDGVQVALYPNE
ncbi:GntR family transcriptional regulator [Carnimonas nigrificans]|uniref:GntR family transcriptional regulator n=1 Tax=Carnimonas nigrificans TaxID=64323 RepID=UPI00046F4A48|nr:GntR family transcriptional regulator [Carnimonas nigrificans]